MFKMFRSHKYLIKTRARDFMDLRVLFIFVVLTSATSQQASSYQQQRQAAIQEDLNQLYDTRPTLASHYQRHSGDSIFLEDDLPAPYFDLNFSGNVTAVLGKTALLNCRVKNIGNRTVSWLRHDDTHLLTIGRLTYTSDLRFKAIHKMYSEDWLLRIKPTTHRDGGRYECQISTTPPTSHIITLTIAEPRTAIMGGPDIHLKEGSTMNLTCIITDSPEPPSYIFWRHNDAIISYDSPRGGVSVITEKGDVTASFLVIQHAKPSDSGTYSCSPSVGDTVSVNVHVLRGEYIARLGTNSASRVGGRQMDLRSMVLSLATSIVTIIIFYNAHQTLTLVEGSSEMKSMQRLTSSKCCHQGVVKIADSFCEKDTQNFEDKRRDSFLSESCRNIRKSRRKT